MFGDKNKFVCFCFNCKGLQNTIDDDLTFAYHDLAKVSKISIILKFFLKDLLFFKHMDTDFCSIWI